VRGRPGSARAEIGPRAALAPVNQSAAPLQQKAAPGDLVFGCNQKISVANSKKNSIKTIRYGIKMELRQGGWSVCKKVCLDKMELQ
jgi:hypothetical protein